MSPRLVDSAWFLPVIGLAIGLLLCLGLFHEGTPGWARWMIGAVGLLAPVAPLLFLLPGHFLAVRRGLIGRSRFPHTVSIDADLVVVEHRGRVMRHALSDVQRARRARNDNWTESKALEDALGLFSASGRELVRVPLSAGGLDALLRALEARGIEVEEVLVEAPAILD